jgi:hypothetical protein
MNFKEWLTLNEDDMRGSKLGLYPSISDNIGQYPPLYITPVSADFITYYSFVYGKNPIKSIKPGIIDSKDTCRNEPHRPAWKMPD